MKLAAAVLIAGIALPSLGASNSVSADTTVEVGTYNLRAPKKNDTNKQRSLLQNANVEVAGLQEINYKNHRFSGQTKYNTLTNFKNDYYPSVIYANAINFAGGGYGIATISHLNVIGSKKHSVYSAKFNDKHLAALRKAYNNFNPDKPKTVKALDELSAKYGTKLVEPRVYQRTIVEKDGKQIAFYNTHLSYESTKLRHKQFKQLINVMKKDKTEYKVLVGDFNEDQGTTGWKVFQKDFNLANGQDGIWRDSFIGDDPTMKVNSIDNIITSKNIEISNVHTIMSTASDHIPLVATLTLK